MKVAVPAFPQFPMEVHGSWEQSLPLDVNFQRKQGSYVVERMRKTWPYGREGDKHKFRASSPSSTAQAPNDVTEADVDEARNLGRSGKVRETTFTGQRSTAKRSGYQRRRTTLTNSHCIAEGLRYWRGGASRSLIRVIGQCRTVSMRSRSVFLYFLLNRHLNIIPSACLTSISNLRPTHLV